MIKVIYDKHNRTISVDGHAGFAEEGKDIVCAAVSALTYALEVAISLHPTYKGKASRYASIAHFYAEIGWRGRKAMQTIAEGLQLIAEQYPQYVKYEERRY